MTTENPCYIISIAVLENSADNLISQNAGVVQWLVRQPSKLDTWVRFPSPAFLLRREKSEDCSASLWMHYGTYVCQ